MPQACIDWQVPPTRPRPLISRCQHPCSKHQHLRQHCAVHIPWPRCRPGIAQRSLFSRAAPRRQGRHCRPEHWHRGQHCSGAVFTLRQAVQVGIMMRCWACRMAHVIEPGKPPSVASSRLRLLHLEYLAWCQCGVCTAPASNLPASPLARNVQAVCAAQRRHGYQRQDKHYPVGEPECLPLRPWMLQVNPRWSYCHAAGDVLRAELRLWATNPGTCCRTHAQPSRAGGRTESPATH